MGLTLILVAGAVILLIGFLAGARFEEHNLERRERALAQGRRLEREFRARRAHELDDRSGSTPSAERTSTPRGASAERASTLTAERDRR